MKKLFQAAAIAAVLAVLSGCAAQGVLESNATDVLVRAGVAEYIAGDADKAEAVISWTEEALAFLDGNPKLLVQELQAFAQRTIPWDDLSPGRQIIAIETLRYVEAKLTDGITAGKLPADATVRLRDLIETAAWAAQFQLALAH